MASLCSARNDKCLFNYDHLLINNNLEYRQVNILRWLNIINASDMISYPLTPLLKEKSSPYLVLEDYYCEDKENWLKQIVGNIEVLGLVSGSITSHTWYWRSSRVADLVTLKSPYRDHKCYERNQSKHLDPSNENS